MSKVKKSEKNVSMCKCMECPTYTKECKAKFMAQKSQGVSEKSNGMEDLYCAFGRSGLIKENKGCLCGTCPVRDMYTLSGGAYCFSGVAT
ncbi:MAG: DUF2769 domain-containing protein [Alphaproteobacteria bacterium]|nr:DUF2769 domain-containing protein [Alphaproteobacteria bacterium]